MAAGSGSSLARAVALAVTGEELSLVGEAPLAEELASLGFDADRLRDIRRSRQEARLPWPHPVPIELRREIGFARYDAALDGLIWGIMIP